MSVVVISSVDEQTRKELAENLARKLGCECIGREQMFDRATEAGIPLGKLEMAVLKRSVPRERLAGDKVRYLAFITAAVCEQAIKGNVVYHGRTAHLFFQSVPHVMKVCLVPDPELRLHHLMKRLNVDWNQAKEYMQRLDEDLESWAHFLHGVNLASPQHFDVVFNLQNMSIQSTSAFLCSMLQSPDFQPTPASLAAMKNLWLAAQARDRLMRDERTGWADLNVTARDGRITAIFMPGQARVAQEILPVLSGLKGAEDIVCTMATTNILWVAERFDPSSPLCSQIVDVARKWGAAVELMRYLDSPEEPNGDAAASVALPPDSYGIGQPPIPKALDMTGGIRDEDEEKPQGQDAGLATTMERLIERNIFGGANAAAGHTDSLVSFIRSANRYSLIVIGDVFTARSPSIRVRLKRETAGLLRERIKVPVITGEELQDKFLFGKRQAMQLMVFAPAAFVLFLAVFAYQEPILNFLAGKAWADWRILATVGVALLVPLFAYFYGSSAGLILKLLKFR
jgi:cytidylate kinase